MKLLAGTYWVRLLLVFAISPAADVANACIQDSDTLSQEKRKSPELAQAILEGPPAVDPKPLRERIEQLRASPKKEEVTWWNDLAGAHLRLGEPEPAIELLTEALVLFPNNYGVNANLGTAYHLTGDYAQAEKFIGRDLEIDPDAHFGLEKYHLALLQYLTRDEAYQMAHVYVDEFSAAFVNRPEPYFHSVANGPVDITAPGDVDPAALEELALWMKSPGNVDRLRKILIRVADGQEPPTYRSHWDLAHDPKLEEGVIYMASLNSKEPAAMTMLGIVGLRKGDQNLAVAAFEKAVALGSIQTPLLEQNIAKINSRISGARLTNWLPGILIGVVLLILVLIVGVVVLRIIRFRRIPKTF